MKRFQSQPNGYRPPFVDPSTAEREAYRILHETEKPSSPWPMSYRQQRSFERRAMLAARESLAAFIALPIE